MGNVVSSGQERLFQDFLKNKRTGLSYSPREYWFSSFHPVGSLIRDPLHEVLSMRVRAIFRQHSLPQFSKSVFVLMLPRINL